MKKILTLVCVSALGGLLTLGGYKLFIEKEQQAIVTETSAMQLPVYVPTSTTNALLTNAERPDLVVAASRTIDAVVHVKNTQISRGATSWAEAISGRYTERKQLAGAGSGVIISPDGHIITNNHVIKDAAEVSITLNNNKTYAAEVVGADEKTDIALLKIDAEDDLPYIVFGDSDTTEIGEWVLAVGNPFNLTSTVTAGIISAKSRDLSGGQSFIQTDAAVNPGNSGGALVNIKGELVGINTAITSQTGSYVGYSFAVPSNIARKIVQDIIEFGDVQDVILGISTLMLNSKEAKEMGIDEIEGVYVSAVEKESGAASAGLKSGDIIKKLDNIEITKFSELTGYLKTKRPNEVVNVEILRNDNKKTIPVKLTKKKDLFIEFLDVQFGNVPESAKAKYDTLEDGGVVIVKNGNSWLKNRVGLREGYVITKINDITIKTIEDIDYVSKKYGDNFIEKLERIEFLDGRLQRKEIVFKD
jgi:Do/DeqQ family serine protease